MPKNPNSILKQLNRGLSPSALIILLICIMDCSSKHLVCVSKQGSAREDLIEIYKMQLEFKSQYGYFSPDLKFIQDKDVDFPGWTIYYNNKQYVGYHPGRIEPLPEHYRMYYNKDSWNAFAVGNPDSDSNIDVWMIDSSGKLSHLEDDCSNTRAHWEDQAEIRVNHDISH